MEVLKYASKWPLRSVLERVAIFIFTANVYWFQILITSSLDDKLSVSSLKSPLLSVEPESSPYRHAFLHLENKICRLVHLCSGPVFNLNAVLSHI